MIEVGLTGNAGSGKTAVARIWAAAGVPVVSADDLAREVVAPGTPGLAEVIDAFGKEIVDARGTLDRKALGAIVFSDPVARRRLEGIVHPRVAELRRDWIEARRREGAALVVSEIPLLFEAGLESAFDVVVLVDAPADVRERRLTEARGLSLGEARRMMAAQEDPAGKRERADHVLDNSGSHQALEARALALLDTLQGGAAPRPPRPSSRRGGEG